MYKMADKNTDGNIAIRSGSSGVTTLEYKPQPVIDPLSKFTTTELLEEINSRKKTVVPQLVKTINSAINELKLLGCIIYDDDDNYMVWDHVIIKNDKIYGVTDEDC